MLNEMEKADRVKVCWACKEYIFIFSNNPVSDILEKVFDSHHIYHMLQTVNYDEINKEEFKLFKIK